VICQPGCKNFYDTLQVQVLCSPKGKSFQLRYDLDEFQHDSGRTVAIVTNEKQKMEINFLLAYRASARELALTIIDEEENTAYFRPFINS